MRGEINGVRVGLVKFGLVLKRGEVGANEFRPGALVAGGGVIIVSLKAGFRTETELVVLRIVLDRILTLLSSLPDMCSTLAALISSPTTFFSSRGVADLLLVLLASSIARAFYQTFGYIFWMLHFERLITKKITDQ